MKKLAVILIVLIFGVFAFFGFKAASKFFPSSRVPSIQIAEIEPTSVPVQQNYLFIHVDDLTIKTPQLISVWVAFYYPSTPPQLITLPVYPTSDSFADDLVGRYFKLDSDKDVSSRFATQIKKVYNIQIDGYIIVDDVAIDMSKLWLTGPASADPAATLEIEPQNQDLLLSEQTNWVKFCQLASAGSVRSYFNAISWSEILPNHFHTDLPFNTITLAIDQITNSPALTKCDVLLKN